MIYDCTFKQRRLKDGFLNASEKTFLQHQNLRKPFPMECSWQKSDIFVPHTLYSITKFLILINNNGRNVVFTSSTQKILIISFLL